MTWHADEHLLAAYAAGRLDDAQRWSLEEHVTGCATCHKEIRDVIVPGVSLDERLEAVWAEVTREIDAPQRRSLADRLLVAAGVPDHVARLVAATPALTMSWLVGVAVTLSAAVTVAWAGQTADPGLAAAPLPFLVLAPLLPLAGVAVSFGPGMDPTYDIGLAAPLHSGRLLLMRTLAVLASTVPLTLLAGLALPALNWTVVAWLLPALGLSSASLALSTRMDPVAAGGLLAVAWVGGVAVVEATARTPLVAFGIPTQVFAALVAAGAGWFVAHQHDRFDRKPVR